MVPVKVFADSGKREIGQLPTQVHAYLTAKNERLFRLELSTSSIENPKACAVVRMMVSGPRVSVRRLQQCPGGPFSPSRGRYHADLERTMR